MSSKSFNQSNSWMDRTLIAVMVISVGILMIGLLSWQIPLGAQVQLDAGDVAPYLVVAPRQITYESPLLTEAARQRAADSVDDQYDMAEGRVRRQQVTQAREILEFISMVREDEFATPELQTDYLLAISDLTLTPEMVRLILDLSNTEWASVVDEVPVALDGIMRDEIRENTMGTARRRVPSMVDLDADTETGQVAIELVRKLIRPNSFINVEQTEAIRADASANVSVQTVQIEAGEVILRAGDIADAEHVEALIQIGLLQREWDFWTVVRSALFTLVIFIMVGAALYRLRPETLTDLTDMAILVVVSSIWLLAAKFMIIPHDWLPFLYPLAALGMLIAVLIDLRTSIVITIAFLFFVQYIGSSLPELMVYAGVGTLLGVLVLGRGERIIAFVWAGVIIVASNLAVMGAYHAPFVTVATPTLIQLLIVTLVNGGLSASIALIGYFALGNLFGITTSLQLTELSRPTHPLLRQLLLKAPGTYHHTIVVSNLAERAAAAIGADAYLSRVGAYYHDIGKTVRPYFFTENIMDGASPHEKLDPLTSAQIIISHVTEGIDLAEKYHLPPRIREFIREHHGRSLVKYFYIKALQEAPEGVTVNEEDFRYPGPNPHSKETAIMLLADTCEAAVRAIRPSSREELKLLIDRLIDERISDGELDESNLTFREVQQVKDIFIRVLEGVHHPRISYPEPTQSGKMESSQDKPIEPNASSDDSVGHDDSAQSQAGGAIEEIVDRALQDPSSQIPNH
jgi:putative nucleotidyltransferase with HDIG domain